MVIDANSAPVWISLITSVFAFLSLIFTGIMAYITAELHENFQAHALRTNLQMNQTNQQLNEITQTLDNQQPKQ